MQTAVILQDSYAEFLSSNTAWVVTSNHCVSAQRAAALLCGTYVIECGRHFLSHCVREADPREEMKLGTRLSCFRCWADPFEHMPGRCSHLFLSLFTTASPQCGSQTLWLSCTHAFFFFFLILSLTVRTRSGSHVNEYLKYPLTFQRLSFLAVQPHKLCSFSTSQEPEVHSLDCWRYKCCVFFFQLNEKLLIACSEPSGSEPQIGIWVSWLVQGKSELTDNS